MVAAFDEASGLGEVEEEGSGRRYPFHCVAIADGTRRIDERSSVSFALRPSPTGLLEAWAITPSC